MDYWVNYGLSGGVGRNAVMVSKKKESGAKKRKSGGAKKVDKDESCGTLKWQWNAGKKPS